MKPTSILFLPAGKKLKNKTPTAFKSTLKRLFDKLTVCFRVRIIRPSHFLFFSSLTLIMLLGLYHYPGNYAYLVLLDDREIGFVSDAEEVEVFVADITDRCSELYGMRVQPEIEIDLIKVFIGPAEQLEPDIIRDLIRQQITFVTDAKMITVDDVPLVPVTSEEVLDEVIDHLEAFYTNEINGSKYLEASVVGDVDLEACSVSPKSIFTAEEVVSLLVDNDNNEEQAFYASFVSEQPDQSLLSSTSSYGSDQQDPQLSVGDPEKQSSGNEETFTNNAGVNVKTVEEVTVTDVIPFTVEIVYDDDMWLIQEEITSPGQEGKKEVIYHITRENGVEVERTKFSEKILEEPVTQIETHGTAQLPSKGTGQFIWPVEGGGEITPGRGFSSWHTGIDIDTDRGINVLAADCGVVWFSGYGGAQGNYLVLYHGAYWTLYLHNSVNHVSKGDRVAQGDVIAEVGSTGRSTGPHLHFEVRRDDGSGEWRAYYQHKPIDPLQFFEP